MNSDQLLQVYNHLTPPRVLVFGDLMLDRYTWGNAERISQEAPIIVLRADQQETSLGGAANVCHLVRGLDAPAACVGVVGNDEPGATLQGLLCELDVHCNSLLVDNNRCTTLKERFVGRAGGRHPSQILRVDHEASIPIQPQLEQELMKRLQRMIPEYDVLLISDYGKGVCTPQLVPAAIRTANEHQVLVLVDPARGGNYQIYRQATLLKPNRAESELATGVKITSPEQAFLAGQRLCTQLDLKLAVITLDRDGMVVVQQDGHHDQVHTAARAVYEITGAGDMAFAMLGFSLGAGAAPLAAVQLANIAAGLAVERMGVATIRPEEILAQLQEKRHLSVTNTVEENKIVAVERAMQLADQYRRDGHKIVFTNGCFDLLHVGHLTNLKQAAEFGDKLFVGVNGDASVRQLKGGQRPVIKQEHRAALLAALECVAHVVIFDDATPHLLLRAIRPDVLVKGGTYTRQEVVGHEVVEAYGGQVQVTEMVPEMSTTRLLESIRQQELSSRAA